MTMREDGLSHIPFHPFSQKAAPAGQIYPPPSARPFFKGLLYWHAKTQSAREISIVRNTRIPLPSHPLSPRCGSQPPPLRGTSFQRKEGTYTLSPAQKPSPLGKVASEARRIGRWRYDNEREKASQAGDAEGQRHKNTFFLKKGTKKRSPCGLRSLVSKTTH